MRELVSHLLITAIFVGAICLAGILASGQIGQLTDGTAAGTAVRAVQTLIGR